MSKLYDVAVVGATGAVGETMMTILEERNFPVGNLYPLASARSAGKSITFRGKQVKVTDLAEFDFSQVQIGLFSAVNPEALAGYTTRNIIANPNCSTIQMLVALKPIYDAVGIERINVCTYQAVSGTGKEAIEELAGQTARLLNGQEIECEVYPKQIAFNVLPHIDTFQDNGYTREEMKLVNPTCVRVPVFFGHSEAVHIETTEKISAADARKLLAAFPGITVMDERADGGYPTPVTESAGKDPVFVGRIREDISHPRGLNLWVVSDNVRKGAALNSVQIAEALISTYLD